MNQFAFLIGAHKTGTTYFNKVLLANLDLLKESGVYFEASGTVKRELTKYLNKPLSEGSANSKLATTREYLFRHKKDFQRLLFSNENISGNIESLKKNKVMYPNVSSRVKNLNVIFEGEPVDLYFFIRNYSDFIESSYSEYIRNCGYIPFSKFHATAFENGACWITVIDNIIDVFPSAHLVVVDNQQLRDHSVDVMNELTSLKLSEYGRIEKDLGRASLSAHGLEIVQQKNRLRLTRLPAKQVDAIAKKYPKSKKYGELQLLTPELRNAYDVQYTRDLETLRQRGLLAKI
ncbi:MAG: hypothetical protein P8I38_07535 [Arenicella sp.]|nr:hypothetical protein [Arenicella sp.]